MSGLVLDLFAGPGGWDEGARPLGLEPIGVEWDMAACQTAMKAGHLRVRADVAALPTEPMVGKVTGLIASPPCTLLSAAGHGTARLVIHDLQQGVRDLLTGDDTREQIRARIHPIALREIQARNAKKPAAKRWTPQRMAQAATTDAFTAALICEPARYIHDLNPEWFALEQVVGAKPIWQTYSVVLREQGWSVWTGTLNAADYGVGQTREREICIGSRTRTVQPPPATHCRGGSDADLFGAELREWRSMADVLGWGATARPVPTITSGGAATGGAEPLARGGRDALDREKRGGGHGSIAFRLCRGAGMNERHGQRLDTPIEQPAPVITSKVRSATWVALP